VSKQTFATGQVLTASQVNQLQSNDFNQTVSVKTAAYTLVVGDRGTRIEFNTSGSVTCTVNSGIFDAGDTLVVQNRGAGVVTVTAGTASVNTSATLALSQYDAGTLYFISASAAIFFNTDAGGGSPLTTKGDLYGFSTLDARIPIGANNTVLTADSTEALGLKWAAASAAAFSGARVVNSGTYTISTATDTLLTFDTETFDTNSYHSTVSNTSRLVAPTTGYYFFEAQVNWDYGGTAPNNPILRVKKNGSIYQVANSFGTANRSSVMQTIGVVELNATDYIEIEVRQDSGGNVTIINANGCTNFTIYSLGA